MQRRLSKEESRQRYAEGRKIWNEFDPIGVVADDDGVDDEYDSYIGPTLRLCEAGKGPSAIEEYARYVVYNRMEMSKNSFLEEAIRKFSHRFFEWYCQSWPDTVV